MRSLNCLNHGMVLSLTAVALPPIMAFPVLAQTPVGSTIAYQGRLTSGGTPASGTYFMAFALFDALEGGNTLAVVEKPVTVVNGLFTAELDYGPEVFQGDARWLEITVVDPATEIPYPLSPRQPLRPVPYALHALHALGGGIGGSGMDNYIPRWNGTSALENSVIYQADDGKVGIGVDDPIADLTIGQNLAEGSLVGTHITVGDSSVAGITLGTDSWHGMNMTYFGESGVGRIYVAFPIAGVHDPLVLQEYGGNVGIGTTSPQQLLHVYGVSNPRILVEAPSTASPEFNLKRGAEAWGLWMNSDNDLNFFHNGNKVTFAPGGDVGIGTSSPTEKLEVAGTAKAVNSSGTAVYGDSWSGTAVYGYTYDGTAIYGRNGSGGGVGYAGVFDGNVDINGYANISGSVGIGTTSPAYKLDVSGDIRATGNVIASCGTLSCSDARYKRDVKPLRRALQKIENLKPVSYEWKREEYADHHFRKGRQLGLIAQEVKKVLPEVVHEDSDGYHSMDYGRLTPLIIEAVKELQADQDRQLREKDERIAELSERVARMETLVAELAEQIKRGVQ